jgi:hypothetical protein
MQSTEAQKLPFEESKVRTIASRFYRGEMKLFLILNSDSGTFPVESWLAIALRFKKIIFQVRL